MRLRSLLLAAAVLAASVPSASAAMRISGDRGGQIGQYLQAYAILRSTGERVIIDGNCLSACTLVLGIIPRERICVTRRAKLGFHAAWMPDEEGRPITSSVGTRALWNIYPADVRRWISRNGGLSRRMIHLQGNELARMVPVCGEAPAPRVIRAQVRSGRSTAQLPRPMVRQRSASAAGYTR